MLSFDPTSYIRTYVPMILGWIIAQLVGLDILDAAGLDITELETELTGLIIAIWYGILRTLEERWPGVGVLLGSVKKPSYS